MRSSAPLLALLLISAAANFAVKAQSDASACVSNLVPCASFMGSSSKPPQTCCGPLKTSITTQLDCLCKLYNTPGLIESFKVNLTQALNMPARCGIDGASLSECSKVGGSSPSPAGSVAPKVTGSTGKDGNGAGKMSGFGISGLLFLVSWVVMLLC